MKKAYLVEYSIKTRVVIDVPDDYKPFDYKGESITDGILIAKAGDKILSDAQNYIIGDNITYVEEDLEMPYDPEHDDVQEEPKRVRRYAVLLRTCSYYEDSEGHVAVFDNEDEAAAIAKEINGVVTSWEEMEETSWQ